MAGKLPYLLLTCPNFSLTCLQKKIKCSFSCSLTAVNCLYKNEPTSLHLSSCPADRFVGMIFF